MKNLSVGQTTGIGTNAINKNVNSDFDLTRNCDITILGGREESRGFGVRVCGVGGGQGHCMFIFHGRK